MEGPRNMLGDILTFVEPTKYAAGLADGSVVRYGAILKNASSGRIVAHIQETGLARQILQSVGPGSFTPWGAVSTLAGGYANVQLHQLQNMMQSLQLLQFANIGLAAAGLGVSVVGFAVLSRRVKAIEGKLDELSAQVKKGFQTLVDLEWRKRLSQVHVYLERAERAHALSDPASEWLRIEGKLDEESGFLQASLRNQLDKDRLHLAGFQKITHALLICDSVRIRCLVQADELESAQLTAQAIAGNYGSLFDKLSSMGLTERMIALRPQRGRAKTADFNFCRVQAEKTIGSLREIGQTADSRPFLIDHLREHGISGSQYLEQLAGQAQRPLTLLETLGG